MGVTLGDAILYLSADPSALNRDLKGAGSKSRGWAKKLGGGLGKLLKVGMLGVGAAVVAGVALMTKAVSEAADFEEAMSKFEVTFGDMSSGLESSLDDMAGATNRSRVELKTMAGDMGAVLKGMGLGEEVAADMSGQMLQLAVDVGSFTNVPMADVADRMTKALTGEFESMKSLGVVINQTRLKQELLNMGVKENVNEVDQATKAQAIMNLMMQSTVDAQGDAERTAGSFTNQMVGLKAGLKDTVTEIGAKLIPVLTPLLAKFGEMAQDVLPRLVDMFTIHVVPIIQTLAGVLSSLVSGDAAGALTKIFGPEVAATIMRIVEGLTKFKARASVVWEKMSAALSEFWTTTGKPIFDQLVAWLQENIPIAIETLTGFWENTLLPAITAVWQFFEQNLLPILVAIGDVVGATIVKAFEVLSGLWTEVLLPAAKEIWEYLKEKLGPIFEKLGEQLEPVKQLFEDVAAWLKEVAENIEKLKLPDFLTGHSPTPLELGLRGINEAMGELARNRLPDLTATLGGGGGRQALAPAMTGATALDQSRSFTVEQMNINNGRDEQALIAILRRASRI